MASYASKVRRDITRWRHAGLVDAATEAALLRDVEANERRALSFGSILAMMAALLLGAAILLARRLGPDRAPLVLGLVIAVQAADGVRGWLPAAVLARQAGPTWTTPLEDPFWAEAAQHYERLRRIPAGNAMPDWAPLAYLAATHGIGTDAVYLARVAREPLAALRARGAGMVATGRFDPAEFYVLDDASACAAAPRIDAGHDLLVRLDGVNVLAPGWLAGRRAPAAAQALDCGVSAPPGSR